MRCYRKGGKNEVSVINISFLSPCNLQLGIVRPAPFLIKHSSVTSRILSTVVSFGTTTFVSAIVSMYSSGSSLRFLETSSRTSPINISAYTGIVVVAETSSLVMRRMRKYLRGVMGIVDFVNMAFEEGIGTATAEESASG